MSKIRWRLVAGLTSFALAVILTAPAAASRLADHPAQQVGDIWPNALVSDIWPNVIAPITGPVDSSIGVDSGGQI